jgi:hypothetical protein
MSPLEMGGLLGQVNIEPLKATPDPPRPGLVNSRVEAMQELDLEAHVLNGE